MSGGHFNYGCFKVSQFADELQHEIDINDDMTLDEWGSSRGQGYSLETMSLLVRAHAILETAGRLAREIEWLYSGDHGEESFRHLVAQFLAGQDVRPSA